MDMLRGWKGEKKTAFYLWWSLSSKSYHRFHNIILPSKNGTAQIDHLVVSAFGVFIVETKNKKGFIFGSEYQHNWVQSIYGNKYSFQNPLNQAYRQKKVLSEFLNLDESHIHTVVYFVGNCRFKTPLPDNVIASGIGRYIRRFQKPVLSKEEVSRVVDVMKRHLSECTLSYKDHIRSLQMRHASNTICPRCGANLTERTAKQGANAGRRFLGCENYPKCRFTKNI